MESLLFLSKMLYPKGFIEFDLKKMAKIKFLALSPFWTIQKLLKWKNKTLTLIAVSTRIDM